LFFIHIKSNIIMRIVLSTIPSPSPSLSLSLSFSLSLSLSLSYPAHLRGRGRVSPRTPASVRADPRTWACVRAYIPPVRTLIFCSFSPLPLVGVVGFAWQRPFRLAKGEGVTSILRGIPLRLLQSKNSRVVFILFMLVYSVMQVFM
jgi:hypothetical protein